MTLSKMLDYGGLKKHLTAVAKETARNILTTNVLKADIISCMKSTSAASVPA